MRQGQASWTAEIMALFRALESAEPPEDRLFDDPAETRTYLAARGLELIADVGAAEYRSRYLGQRRGPMRGYEFYRVAVARVAPSSDAA